MKIFEKGTGSRLVLVFVVQTVVGTLLFAFIAILAIGLNLAAHRLETTFHIDDTIVTILKAVEVAILCVDASLFLLYLLAEGIKFVREAYKLVAEAW